MRLSKTIQAISMAFLLNAMTVIDQATAAPTPHSAQPSQIARRRMFFRLGIRPTRYRISDHRDRSIRNRCTATALVPPLQERMTAELPVDKTIAERPTFFVNVPAVAAAAQFTLQTEALTEEIPSKEIHNVKFKLTGKPGIVGISLPSSVPALQIGQKYLWQMAVQCNPRDRSNDSVVMGWIERVQPPAADGGNPLNTLAEAGIWQDTMSTLALRRYEQPDDRTTTEDWASLMEDAEMPQFKDTPIVQIVQK
jgi:hypothetical protein